MGSGGRERGACGRGRGTHKGHRWGHVFGFPNPETRLPVARVPDVLSKAPSLGRPWDPDYPSKPAWPLLAALHMGGLAPWPVSATPAQPLPLGPSAHAPHSAPGKQLRRHACRTGHHGVQAPTPPRVCPRKSVLWGKNQAQATCPGPWQGRQGTGAWQIPRVHDRRGPSTGSHRLHSALRGTVTRGQWLCPHR